MRASGVRSLNVNQRLNSQFQVTAGQNDNNLASWYPAPAHEINRCP